MKVYVNNISIKLFTGARAKDAILKYNYITNEFVPIRNLIITDKWGNEIAEDSGLEENDPIFIQKIKIDK